jgi:hypothetical protein
MTGAGFLLGFAVVIASAARRLRHSPGSARLNRLLYSKHCLPLPLGHALIPLFLMEGTNVEVVAP